MTCTNKRQRAALWIGLALVSGTPRLIAAFLFPNPDGDAYSYFGTIETWRAHLAAGTFSVKELHSFWLPLYQFISAVLSLVVDHPMYVSKVVSAICGTGSCMLVFSITRRLTANQKLALLAFALIALNPLHICLSAFTMTDVPHAFLVLFSLSCVIQRRWTLAAICAAAASLIRVESWMLVALIPALQFLRERRVSLPAICILVTAPVLWLYICWMATGNPFAYFAERNRYITESLAAYPVLQSFSKERLRINLDRMLISISHGVLAAGCIGLGLIIQRLGRLKRQPISAELFAVVSSGLFFFAFLAFLLLSFFTNNQPDLWERYGLIIFALGIPFAGWALLTLSAGKPNSTKAHVAFVIVIACIWQVDNQLPYISGYRQGGEPEQILANNLVNISQVNPQLKVFCDDAAIRSLSGFSQERIFVTPAAPSDQQGFLTYLKEHGIEYLVYADLEGSAPTMLFPELRSGMGNEFFQLLVPMSPKDWHGKVWLYQYRKEMR